MKMAGCLEIFTADENWADTMCGAAEEKGERARAIIAFEQE